jgi:molybdate transport system permease protein
LPIKRPHDRRAIQESGRSTALLDLSPAALVNLSPAEWTAIWLSLRIAVVATIISLPLGIFTAYALARWHFPGKSIVNGIVHMPLVLPPVVTGFILLILLGRKGVIGGFLADIGIVLSFRWTGAAVACAVMGFPLMVRAMRLSFEAIDRRLELASATLGASRIWTFFLITLPLAIPGIVVGATSGGRRSRGRFGRRNWGSGSV